MKENQIEQATTILPNSENTDSNFRLQIEAEKTNIKEPETTIRELNCRTQNLDVLRKLMEQKNEVIKKYGQEPLNPYEQEVYNRRFEIADKFEIERFLQEGGIIEFYEMEKTMEELVRRRIKNKIRLKILEIKENVYTGKITEEVFFNDYYLNFLDIESCRLSETLRLKAIQQTQYDVDSITKEIETDSNNISISTLIKKGLLNKNDVVDKKIKPEAKKEVIQKIKNYLLLETTEYLNRIDDKLKQGDMSDLVFSNNHSYAHLKNGLEIKLNDLRNVKINVDASIKIENTIVNAVVKEEDYMDLYRNISESRKRAEGNIMLDINQERIGAQILDNVELMDEFCKRKKH